MSLREKLNKIASEDTSSNWLEETGKELAEQGARKKARQLALRVLQLLRQQGLTQTQLAERMQVSRQQVTKIIKGNENFTFETIDKLEKALGVTLMTIESPKQMTAFEHTRISSTVQVHRENDQIQRHGRWIKDSHRYKLFAEAFWVVSDIVRVRGSEVTYHLAPAQEGLDYCNA